jgi:MtrB/PioB family decaheme-associated outer membrane protein
MRKIELAVIALVLVVLAVGPAAAADPSDAANVANVADKAEATKAFIFHLDPLDFGVQLTDVDNNSAKFEEYRDLKSGFILPKLGLTGESGDGNRTFSLQAENLRRDDARYTLDYGVAGKYSVTLDYNKIPHRFGNDGHTLEVRTGPGRYEIADPTQAAIQGAVASQFAISPAGVTFGFLNNLLTPYLAAASSVNVGLQRDRTRAEIALAKGSPIGWTLEYTHENRVGTRPFGGSFGFNNVVEIPEPIDYDTTGAGLTGTWGSKRGSLSFGYRWSKFENNISTVTWDNPFRAVSSTDPSAYLGPSSSSMNGSTVGFADLAASNKADTAFLSGRATLGGSWWANGSVNYTQMKQDDPLLPYTLNSAIRGINFDGTTFDPTNPANLPARNADNKVDVTSLNGNLGSRLGDRFSLTFRYRYYDYDNKSKRIEFPGYVRFQSVWENIARVSVPYAYKRQDLGAELNWDVARNTTFGLSYNLQSWDRKFREVAKSDEGTLKLTFDARPKDWVSLRAGYTRGDRHVDHYDPNAAEASFVEAEAITNLPALRKYDEAPRVLDAYNASVQLTPSEAWSFQVGVTRNKEDYTRSQFGLLNDDTLSTNLELGYTPNEHNNVYVFGEIADRKTDQRSRQSAATPSVNPLDDWGIKFKERNDTWGLGWTAKPADRWTFDLLGRYSKSDGSADFFAFAGGAPLASPPRTAPTDIGNYEDYKLVSGEVKLGYRLTANATAGLTYRYEDYTIDSFILQGLTNYLPGALLLDANNGDYTGNIFALTLKLTL